MIPIDNYCLDLWAKWSSPFRVNDELTLSDRPEISLSVGQDCYGIRALPYNHLALMLRGCDSPALDLRVEGFTSPRAWSIRIDMNHYPVLVLLITQDHL
jgi:hypothetical protein